MPGSAGGDKGKQGIWGTRQDGGLLLLLRPMEGRGMEDLSEGRKAGISVGETFEAAIRWSDMARRKPEGI